ncbi:LysR substrate-binding domain-containing protein [Marinobacterium rhizophilum]|uniref:LysR family transcriptional regulator n=1 Tax=Marinobacterium rhizophilum TaxID=420402 RepID=A0ABY5HCL5_9GAMM|nr:LysR substrate-binding domain-containing protein [Marinobacterium rhizophilum]UTW10092.1 LysR family transcriptional regulator [Marinobacterium rhizophilum]
MRKKELPSFSALIAFESAARHQSFKHAAGDLCISQAAISRQIRTLEEHLGCELFERRHRAVRLSDDGRFFLDAVTLGLNHIEAASRQLRDRHESSSVKIGLMSSLAGLFLAPRLGEFRRQHADIDIYIISTEANPEPQRERYDIMVSMGEPSSTAYDVYCLFNEVVFPVCSPNYLASNPAIRSFADLAGHTLLSTDSEHWSGIPWPRIDWPSMFQLYGIECDAFEGLRYSNYQMMLNTVVSGHGICLGWKHLVTDLLNSGTLVKPLAQAYETDRKHYLLIKKSIAHNKNVILFRDWFLEQVAQMNSRN